MIQADTIVHFYYDLETTHDYENSIRSYLKALTGPVTTEEIISIAPPFMSRSGLTSRVVVKFKVLMEERQSCKHLDDYVGTIFPTVKKNISGELISTQNLAISFVRSRENHQQKKINWEELYHHWNE
ncbi:hypothetical protein ACERII_17885 [Evansella sp. AB-rgal1]|uniref:hypothetical protein n=1 Tax=Evansella sp. AB-rgal1 TaxID=3242696 RepID=UPI00359ED45B